MSIGNQPAFPAEELPGMYGPQAHQSQGMSYRQWLVGMALQGLLTTPSWVWDSTSRSVYDEETGQTLGECAAIAADDAIAELEKAKP
jgi:hypothetical protein